MSLENETLPFDRLLELHVAVRDAIADTVYGEHDLKPELLWRLVAFQSFSYAFNTYKAIGMVLPELYHEAASAMLRQLWEVSLNIHWIERDPDPRARDFCNFTVMEMRKNLILEIDTCAGTGESDHAATLEEFDRTTARFQSSFRYRDRKGRGRLRANFATSSIQDRSNELGKPWQTDYQLLYRLTSMHAHGAPGAVLHQMFFTHSPSREAKERDRSSLVALVSMDLLIRDVHLLVRQGFIPDSAKVDAAFDTIRG